MCATCGCSPLQEPQEPGEPHQSREPHQFRKPHQSHEPHESHESLHDHGHQHGEEVTLEQKILAKNDDLARRNRSWLRERGILAVNLMSSPGSGKTTLLERSGRDLAGRLTLAVIEGDQETALDADRIRAAGSQVVQINTGAGCHLDAAMVGGALRDLDPAPGSVVVIENVGNLVCPALFDLGEAARVVLASVTEGTDKPLKYPQMFRSADLVVVTKTDLGPYVDFDVGKFGEYIGQVSPQAMMINLSSVTGGGLGQWYDWLGSRVPASPPPRDSAGAMYP
jgi:hydrogenase nickel incorporation protein HypB